MKVYGHEGDQGSTDLRGDKRTGKDSARIEAIGSIDELNCVIGTVLSREIDSRLSAPLAKIQELLHRLASDLAQAGGAVENPLTEDASVDQLERWSDQFGEGLPELKTFVLPGGVPLAAELQWARAVCRRAERRCCNLASREPVPRVAIPLLNRLSDLLFILARRANFRAGQQEVLWKPAEPK